jgi:hypothetical protein
MYKQGREKHAITDLCGNIKNQFRDANLSILWEVAYFTLGIICANTVKLRYSPTVSFYHNLWRVLRVLLKKIWP